MNSVDYVVPMADDTGDFQEFTRRNVLRGSAFAALGLGASLGLGAATTGCAPFIGPDGTLVDPLDVIWPPDERRRLVWRAPRNPGDPLRLPEPRSRSALVIGGGLAGLSAALELAERGYAVTVRESGPEFGGRLATRDLDPGLGRTFRVEHGLHMWFDNYRVFRDIRSRLDIDHHFRPYKTVNFVFRDYLPEELESDPKIFPLNLAAIIDRSPNLDWPDIFGAVGILPDLLGFQLDGLYERLDTQTFDQWMDANNVSTRFRDIVLQPAAHVTLNDGSELSAAEMLLYQHLYFISQPFAFDREITTVDHGTAIIDPWVAKLRSLGAVCRTGSAVSGLAVVGDRVVGTTDDDATYDWVVLACDVGGVKQVLSGSTGSDNAASGALARLTDRLAPQGVAPPYRILRMWFDRPLDAARPDVIETPQHHPLALICQFHQLEDESKEWAATTGGSIIEFHLYAIDEALAAYPDADLWAQVRPTVLEVVPELADAQVLGFTVGSYRNFTSFAVGTGVTRPHPESAMLDGLANLMLAGDWVGAPTPSALMERSVVTGRLAANECLLADGVRESGYQHVSPLGPGV